MFIKKKYLYLIAGLMVTFASNNAYALKPVYPVYHKGEKLYPIKKNNIVNSAPVNTAIAKAKKNTVKPVPKVKSPIFKPAKNVAIIPPVPGKKIGYSNLVIKPVVIHIKHGETRVVKLSLTQINRIVINSYIQNVKTTKTANISVLLQGKDAYVQWTPLLEKQGNISKVKYIKQISSIIFNTKKGIFTLVVVPARIPGQTVYIKQKYSSSKYVSDKGFYRIDKKGVSHYFASIYKNVYNDLIPAGFTMKKESVGYKTSYPEIKAMLVKKYIGGFLNIYEFYVYNKSDNTISLSNKEFINLINRPLSISLSNEHLFKNTFTRLFIISKGVNRGQ